MVTLYDDDTRVKALRRHRRFGEGLVHDNTRPPVRPYSDQDDAWHASDRSAREARERAMARLRRRYSRMIDEMAAEAAAREAIESGCYAF